MDQACARTDMRLGAGPPDLVGVDGCKGGWFAARRDARSGEISTRMCASFAELLAWAPAPAIIAVDIPIGLSSQARRSCEREARALLAWPRSSSVFSTPLRQTLAAADYADANARHRAVMGHGISQQAFHILPKIAEVDELLRTSAAQAGRVFEVHPELVFMQLQRDAGGPAGGVATPKRLAEGRAIRCALLAPFLGEALRTALSAPRRKELQPDDIVDAFAALWSAGRIHAGLAVRLPAHDEYDAHGLQMAIRY